ncbi:unnamed protein product [Vitrella brassicaformis CCMP3155]|uniref:Uncharacterized protein n=1 Tax=Vitrella brassicaformis (strain CCMP3155) TaxID=1169540 RepID=A0A0G4GHT9_VITBC|nr:unnamed protein product [Vitrella brassicaformis CCMP3155]|eukprot:CEM29317.1 unnamed protein product [Vitrella brassicaformis CCMP3155]
MASDSVPSLWELSLKKASHILDDPTRRPALVRQIDKQPPTEIPRGVTLPAVLQERIERAMHPEDLHDHLAFDIPDLAGALKTAHVLERCSGHWKLIKPFIRLAFIYQLTPLNATRPLLLSADSLPITSAFDELPLTMATYKTFGHVLKYRGTSLALRRADNGEYRIGNKVFRVVPLDELPADHPYRSTHEESDPVICYVDWLYPSFTAFATWMVVTRWSDQEGVGQKEVLRAYVGRDDTRFQRLLTAGDVPEQLGITADDRLEGGDLTVANRYVIVSGFRPTDAVAAFVLVAWGDIELWTTESAAAGASASLDERFPMSMPRWRSVLRRFELESDVIDVGEVLV